MALLILELTVAEADVKPLIEALRSVKRPARLDRDCLSARLLRDIEEPERLTYVESWASEDALSRRIASPEFGRLLALMEAQPSPPALEFVVAGIRGLEYVEAVRLGRPATAE